MSSKLMPTSTDKFILKANTLGKCYKIYDDPKSRLKQALWRGRKKYYREFWAVRNISFEVKKGESLGVIGRNGSGKSTLLQMICGTLTPTEGSISANGRVAALLELGSGFNPEFTGLENIYLNASLLGLSRMETEAKLEDILSFADIGEFINQPTKSYSSGMTVRLAFAVIAHTNADVFIIDEALAVGDAIFVNRCMRFIRKMREERCLVFVSHDAEAVKSLCSHALWLSKGQIQSFGTCREVTLKYLLFCQATNYVGDNTVGNADYEEKNQLDNSQEVLDIVEMPINPSKDSHDYAVTATLTSNLTNANEWKTENAKLVHVGIEPIKSKESHSIIRGGEEVIITIHAISYIRLTNPILGFLVRDRLGQIIFGENSLIIQGKSPRTVLPGEQMKGTFRLWLPMLPSGTYSLTAAIAEGDSKSHISHHWVEDAIILNVVASNVSCGLVGAFITKVELEIYAH